MENHPYQDNEDIQTIEIGSQMSQFLDEFYGEIEVPLMCINNGVKYGYEENEDCVHAANNKENKDPYAGEGEEWLGLWEEVSTAPSLQGANDLHNHFPTPPILHHNTNTNSNIPPKLEHYEQMHTGEEIFEDYSDIGCYSQLSDPYYMNREEYIEGENNLSYIGEYREMDNEVDIPFEVANKRTIEYLNGLSGGFKRMKDLNVILAKFGMIQETMLNELFTMNQLKDIIRTVGSNGESNTEELWNTKNLLRQKKIIMVKGIIGLMFKNMFKKDYNGIFE